MAGKFHTYAPWHILFEYISPNGNPEAPPLSSQSNILLFIGGLGDTFGTVPYVSELPSALAAWTICHAALSSSGKGWGMADLSSDATEIGMAVEYLRERFGKATNVVLMGHSTGCQDILHYLYSSSENPRPKIQGAILQAPVSDREGMLNSIAKDAELSEVYEQALKFSYEISQVEKADTIIPIRWSQRLFFDRTPVSVSRFESLASPKSPEEPGLDDLFSSDLTDQRLAETFGKIGQSTAFGVAASTAAALSSQPTKPSMLVLVSGADEYVPESVDKEKLIGRWKKAVEKGGDAVLDQGSCIVEGGKHNLRGKDGERKKAREHAVEVVKGYLGRMVGGRDTTITTLPHRPSL